MALIEKLTAIADAIRSKTGKEDKLTLEQMATEIESIEVGGNDELGQMLIDNTFTELNSDKITAIGAYGLAYRTTLQKVNLPNLTSAGSNAFFGCIKLSEAKFGENFTEVPQSMFYSCNSLKDFDFSHITHIGNTAFTHLNAEKIVLPKLVSMGSAFYNNSHLKHVDLWEKISLAQLSFGNASSMETLILRSNSLCPLLYVSALQNTPIAKGTGYIYVPKALIEDYKVATNWITYSEQFRAIEDYPEICGGVTE